MCLIFSNIRKDPVVYKLCFAIKELFCFTLWGSFSDTEMWVSSITVSLLYFFPFPFYTVEKKWGFFFLSLNPEAMYLTIISKIFFIECFSVFYLRTDFFFFSWNVCYMLHWFASLEILHSAAFSFSFISYWL